VEGSGPRGELKTPPGSGAAGGDYGGRLLGVVVAGALLAAIASAAAGFGLEALGGSAGFAGWADGFRAFLGAGGWLWLPLWGAALGALRAVAWAPSARHRLGTVAVALALASLPLVLRPAYVEMRRAEHPRTPRAKARAILKWSYGSPAAVGNILELSRDPEPRVREQAVLALGVNLVVADIERATSTRPSTYARYALRDSLRARLLEALRDDPAESVRAEAARALWKAPATFGRQRAAAETLGAVLDRAPRPGAVERLAWLALDAAAGAPDPGLKAAAARFAAATPDTGLARVARMAAR